jgi:diguanylate cyclase (GGDEF)-like protein
MQCAGIRRIPWSWAGVVVGATVIACAAMGFSYLPGWSGPAWDVAWTTAAIGALAGTLFARTRAHPASRSRWTLWALAVACWLGGQLAWNVYGVVGFSSSPNVADAGWWAFALLVIFSLLRVSGPRGVRLVALVEAVPLIGAAIALAVAELWPALTGSSLPLAAKLSALVYPIVYGSAVVLMLQAMVGGVLCAQRTMASRLVFGGMAAQALAFMLWSDQLLRGTYAPGKSFLDPLWVVGLAAMGVGGLIAAARPERPPVTEEPSYRGGVLPTGMFLLLVAATVRSRLGHSAHVERVVLEAGLICSAGALLIRSRLLAQRMRVMLERERTALVNLAEREVELAELNEQLVEDSRRDPLTGLKNRRALAHDLPMIEAMHSDEGEQFAFALCDIDHFKAYNDLLGHLAGDQALRMIAAVLRGELRAGDSAYRFGGEELLLVMRGVGIDDAFRVAERVRVAVKRAAIPHPRSESGFLTVSIGLAAGSAETGKLLGQADGALYEAKRTGRNRVLVGSSGASMPGLARNRRLAPEEPVPHHLRSMLAISRAAASGGGAMPVLKAVAEAIRIELSFQIVVVNVFDEDRERLQVVIVDGDEEARAALMDTSSPWSEWEALLAGGEDVRGAAWLKAGSFTWETEAVVYTPPAVASLSHDAWHPEDMLLLPLRGADGEVLGVISVDQPLSGCRPTREQIGVLMAVADHAGLALEQAQRDSEAVRHQSQELRLAAVLLLAETLDMRDPSTAKHARTVGQLARQTAAELGFEPNRVERVTSAGVLHDIGKLGIADAILHKPAALDEAEWRETKRHPVVGARILEHAGLRDLALWVGQHHERMDGLGYPAGLMGDEITLEARILAVADAYEAMIAERPYQAGMSAAKAREELVRCGGSHFDPQVVKAFLSALDRDAKVTVDALEPAA